MANKNIKHVAFDMQEFIDKFRKHIKAAEYRIPFELYNDLMQTANKLEVELRELEYAISKENDKTLQQHNEPLIIKKEDK